MCFMMKNHNAFKGLVNRYMFYDKYAQEHRSYGLIDDRVSVDLTSLEVLDLILNYKKKVAKGKPIKYNHGVLIDLKDCFPKLEEMGLGKILSPDSFRCSIDRVKETLGVLVKYSGNLCLPFSHCTIYSRLEDYFVTVIDIKDIDGGKFGGTLYEFRAKDIIFQTDFLIAKKEGEWHIGAVVDKYKRPLGTCMSNISVLLDTIAVIDNEDAERIMRDYSEHPLGFALMKILTKLIAALGCLGSYKSKTLYEVNTRSNVYIYADKDENLDEYVDEQYNGCDYKKLDGWLVSGHWKLIPDEQYGVDRQGKSIKGVTWVQPYKKESETAQTVTVGEQEAKIIPNHALERAKERYGMILTNEDLDNIVEACVKGKDVVKLNVKDKFGKIKSAKSNMSGCYRLKYNKKYIDVVISRGVETSSHRVATFLPAPKDVKCTIIDSKSYNLIQEDCAL